MSAAASSKPPSSLSFSQPLCQPPVNSQSSIDQRVCWQAHLIAVGLERELGIGFATGYEGTWLYISAKRQGSSGRT
jgi:hypothetical protein